MNDDELKTLVRKVRIGVECSAWACDAVDPLDVLALLAHIDAEPARQAAAVAAGREEQREADVRSCPTCKGEGFTMRVRECPFCDDSTHDHECPTDEVKVYCLCGAARIRATPLTATPLKDENKALREDLEHERKTNERLLAERDAALARVRELEAQPHVVSAVRITTSAASVTEPAQEVEERIAALSKHYWVPASSRQLLDLLQAMEDTEAASFEAARRYLLERDALRAERDELRRRILDSCPSPDEGGRIHAGGRIVCGQCHDSEVSHLRAQLAEAVGVLRELSSAVFERGDESNRVFVARHAAQAFLAKHPEGT